MKTFLKKCSSRLTIATKRNQGLISSGKRWHLARQSTSTTISAFPHFHSSSSILCIRSPERWLERGTSRSTKTSLLTTVRDRDKGSINTSRKGRVVRERAKSKVVPTSYHSCLRILMSLLMTLSSMSFVISSVLQYKQLNMHHKPWSVTWHSHRRALRRSGTSTPKLRRSKARLVLTFSSTWKRIWPLKQRQASNSSIGSSARLWDSKTQHSVLVSTNSLKTPR